MPLSNAVESAVRALPSICTWHLAKFRVPDMQTLAASDLLHKVYASSATGRFDTVLVQTKGTEEAGASGLEGEHGRQPPAPY